MTSGRPGNRGAVQTALERLYERLGSRIHWVCMAAAVAIGVVNAIVVLLTGGRLVRLPLSEGILFLSLGVPLGLAGALLAAIIDRREIRTILSWRGAGRTAERAPEVWRTLVRASRAS